MKKSDAHAFITQAINDFIAPLPVSMRIAMGEKLQVALDALRPGAEESAPPNEPPKG